MRRLVWLALAAGLAQGSGPDRRQAIERGLRFIYQTSCDPRNFASFGEDYLWCFYSIGSTSKDPALARLALAMGRERAAVWSRENATLPENAPAGVIDDTAFGAYVAEKLGYPNPQLKERVRQAAPRYTVVDYLKFDPWREPPPGDVPEDCRKCSLANPRGATVCRRCGAPLTFRSRYSVWFDALLTSYTGDRYGVTLGAPYAQVIRWLPSMRPYRARGEGTEHDFYDTAYSITHVVYTMNDYSQYRLSPSRLPDEFAYLKANLKEPIAMRDPETLGEFLDTLKSFGLKDSDPLIRSGVEYLLATQNPDGSWGDMKADDIYLRYHPTWTAIDGLRDYKWKGRR
jgi:hypothetical protein